MSLDQTILYLNPDSARLAISAGTLDAVFYQPAPAFTPKLIFLRILSKVCDIDGNPETKVLDLQKIQSSGLHKCQRFSWLMISKFYFFLAIMIQYWFPIAFYPKLITSLQYIFLNFVTCFYKFEKFIETNTVERNNANFIRNSRLHCYIYY